MSQQPPYGPSEPQQPYQPQPQPYTPYSQGAYPNPYAQVPQQPNHTTRNVLLIVGAVVLLFCGGVVAFFVWVFTQLGNGFDSDYAGSVNDPLTVDEGEAFSIRGFDYDAGWTITTSSTGSASIEGLRVTNDRDDEDSDSVSIYVDFLKDNARLGSVTCSGGASIGYERSAQLTCTGYTDVTGYDEIEVYDGTIYD